MLNPGGNFDEEENICIVFKSLPRDCELQGTGKKKKKNNHPVIMKWRNRMTSQQGDQN